MDVKRCQNQPSFGIKVYWFKHSKIKRVLGPGLGSDTINRINCIIKNSQDDYKGCKFSFTAKKLLTIGDMGSKEKIGYLIINCRKGIKKAQTFTSDTNDWTLRKILKKLQKEVLRKSR